MLSRKQVAASAAVGFDSTFPLRSSGSSVTKFDLNMASFIGNDVTSCE